jgi:calcineurin-like phosphoesterase family protein
MRNIFLVSDTHFSHKGMTVFLREDGSKLRPWDSIEEMDEALIENWNKVVGHNDKVYHLGDVVINKRALVLLNRLNGTKILIKGNHDIFKLKDYTPYFKDIRAYHVLDKMIFSHIPIHPAGIERFRCNVHGHLHDRVVGDSNYVSVCVERINYTPIELGEILDRL